MGSNGNGGGKLQNEWHPLFIRVGLGWGWPTIICPFIQPIISNCIDQSEISFYNQSLLSVYKITVIYIIYGTQDDKRGENVKIC